MAENVRRTIVQLCGPPGVGKSTQAQIWKEKLNSPIILSVDNFIERVARYYRLTYKECCTSKILSRGKKRLTKLVRLAIAHNRDVIWDQTNLIEELRTEHFNKFPSYYKVLGAAKVPSLSFLKERNETRERGKLNFNMVVNRLAKLYRFPDQSEVDKVDFFYEF
jgi:tRNA uridine 5-carbamoylmethylation protein Kti12